MKINLTVITLTLLSIASFAASEHQTRSVDACLKYYDCSPSLKEGVDSKRNTGDWCSVVFTTGDSVTGVAITEVAVVPRSFGMDDNLKK